MTNAPFSPAAPDGFWLLNPTHKGLNMSIASEPKLNGVNGHEDVDVQALLSALTALRKGDFSMRLPSVWLGLAGKVADTFNDVMDQLEGMTSEVDRISRVVGKEGKIKQRANLGAGPVGSQCHADATCSIPRAGAATA